MRYPLLLEKAFVVTVDFGVFWFLGQNKADLMKRLAEFRATSVPKPMGRDWARILKTRIIDGKRVPLACEQMANEALRFDFTGEEEAV